MTFSDPRSFKSQGRPKSFISFSHPPPVLSGCVYLKLFNVLMSHLWLVSNLISLNRFPLLIWINMMWLSFYDRFASFNRVDSSFTFAPQISAIVLQLQPKKREELLLLFDLSYPFYPWSIVSFYNFILSLLNLTTLIKEGRATSFWLILLILPVIYFFFL